MEFEAVIGLEVHVELNTKSKIFCSCSTEFGKTPNSNVCPVCAGMPGVLPVLNAEALKKAILAGLSLNGTIPEFSRFDRKQYFYPDLPKGYQISQLDYPVMKDGFVNINVNGKEKKIRINRLHMEEDAGKLVHLEDSSEAGSLVDLNRAGVPLVEIVSEPDLSSPEEAYLYLVELKKIMKYIDVSDCNMEEGSLRCDANVSVRPKGETKLGTKAEIKNVNSFKFVEKAIEYEIKRQVRLIEEGGRVVQETRLYDSDENKTYSMRSKEEANDYRYFPEPDLVPLKNDKAFVDSIRKNLPELHYQVKDKLIRKYGLSDYDAEFISNEKPLADYFQVVLKHYDQPKNVANWLMGDISKYLNDNRIEFGSLGLNPEYLAKMLKMIDSSLISSKIGKTLLVDMIMSGKDPDALVKEKGLVQISDSGELEKIIDEVLGANTENVASYKAGKTGLLGSFVGQVMKKTQGKANPKLVNEILLKKLS